MDSSNWLWWIPFLPLVGSALCGVLHFLTLRGRRAGAQGAGPGAFAAPVAIGAMAASFGLSVAAFFALRGLAHDARVLESAPWHWIDAGSLAVDVSMVLDPLSSVMTLVVTGVGLLIHVYSAGYMKGDPGYAKFFAFLNLFAFAMLLLVTSSSVLGLFVGWEGVGLCSYLLIGFWYEKGWPAEAGQKAFVVNRIGDACFLLGTFLLVRLFGTLDLSEVAAGVRGLLEEDGARTQLGLAALLLFGGACGKSAQLPLFVWLPDAMAGPTPVSALIHAATMVTSGVYLVVRLNPLFAAAPAVLLLIGVVAAATAFIAGSTALVQRDIKKVLAYSTVSQLGYMFLGLATGAWAAAMFHLVTHAFFKALLFLGAGSVIHGMHEEQDMRKMGGLRRYMPVTFLTFLVGWLAIAGIPPFAGFWSKDEILLFAWQEHGVALWVVGLVAALLTALYMSRLMFLTFFGEPRWGAAALEGSSETAAEGHGGDDGEDPAEAVHGEPHLDADFRPHESPPTMTVPLVLLAVFSAGAGIFNLPFSANFKFLESWIEPVVETAEAHITVSGAEQFVLAAISVVFAAVGIFLAYRTYLAHKIDASLFERDILARAWHIDEGYAAFVSGPGTWLFDALVFVDTRIVDGAVNGVATVVRGGSLGLRRLQSGYVRNYALWLAVGAVLVLAWFLTKAGI